MANPANDTVYGGFRFAVSIEGLSDSGLVNQSFVRVSSVESESEEIVFMMNSDTYINGMPGRPGFGFVELERVYDGKDAFYAWRRQVEAGQVVKRDVVVTILDRANQPVRRMVCHQAWPKKWALPTLNAGSSEPAIERITLAVTEVYEGEVG